MRFIRPSLLNTLQTLAKLSQASPCSTSIENWSEMKWGTGKPVIVSIGI
ncbi:hypothetical protein JCM19239_7365 [Vibrio variabilis]|uniref:Uncharacterized protein n=1 Tax=Vibrio variabilis TaxID=990271 RepID=A0ABQ0J7L3_9VIBR|nr:hypothetical protein JCM19239_7365 [Vibrio variabilis]